MYEAALISVAIAAFFLGFRLGSNTKTKHTFKTHNKRNTVLEKEYENFLNYNGEEQ